MARVAAVLGDEFTDAMDDALISGDDDASQSAGEDPRGDYVAWAQAVKRFGGVVTAFPFHMQGTVPTTSMWDMPWNPSTATATGDLYGVPAAMYPVTFVFPNAPDATLNPAFHRQPDAFSGNGRNVYYIAPMTVLRYAAGDASWFRVATGTQTGMNAPQSNPSEPPPPNPDWYNKLLDSLKAGGWILAALLGLVVVSYLPRGRGE